MISSWRRGDCDPVDPATGTVGGAYRLLGAADDSTVSVLHLAPGGSTPVESAEVGHLVLITAGSATVHIGEERLHARAGDAVRWPRDVPHSLETDEGVSAFVVTYPEERQAWRVTRIDARGRRWVVGVFSDTDKARHYRDLLRAEAGADEQIVLE